jgi:3-oxoacyl-[acyl-carrier protein] reductase
VTGSTGGGMGRSIALTLAQNGADIVLNYGTNRDSGAVRENALSIVQAVESMGRQALLIHADTRDPYEVRAMVLEAVARFGKIDILVNNAGGGWLPGDIAEKPPKQFRDVVAAEVDGAFLCIQACLPIMRENHWGRIINLGAFKAGTWAAEGGEPVDYAIGKAGRAILTRHLALRERQHNITVNLINPGPEHTAHFESTEQALSYLAHGDDWQARTRATPQDIAEAVLFLCSEAARFITGSHIAFSIE